MFLHSKIKGYLFQFTVHHKWYRNVMFVLDNHVHRLNRYQSSILINGSYNKWYIKVSNRHGWGNSFFFASFLVVSSIRRAIYFLYDFLTGDDVSFGRIFPSKCDTRIMKLENGETIAYIAILNILTHQPKPSSLKTQRVNSKSNPLHTSKYEHHFENLKIYTIEALSVFLFLFCMNHTVCTALIAHYTLVTRFNLLTVKTKTK